MLYSKHTFPLDRISLTGLIIDGARVMLIFNLAQEAGGGITYDGWSALLQKIKFVLQLTKMYSVQCNLMVLSC